MIVCNFSGLDHLKKRDHGKPDLVLRALVDTKQVSTFEITPKLWDSMLSLCDAGFIRFFQSPYPWHHVEVTDAGRDRLFELEHPANRVDEPEALNEPA